MRCGTRRHLLTAILMPGSANCDKSFTEDELRENDNECALIFISEEH
jgi:hypothetical protein